MENGERTEMIADDQQASARESSEKPQTNCNNGLKCNNAKCWAKEQKGKRAAKQPTRTSSNVVSATFPFFVSSQGQGQGQFIPAASEQDKGKKKKTHKRSGIVR